MSFLALLLLTVQSFATDPCAEPVVTATTALASNCTTVSSLRIDSSSANATSGNSLAFPHLTSIALNLTIDSPPSTYTDISLPALTNAPSTIDFSASSWSGNVTFDALTDAPITDVLFSIALGNIHVSAPKLTSVGTFTVFGAPIVAAVTVDLPELATVSDTLFFSSLAASPGTTGCFLPQLRSVYGDLIITTGQLDLATFSAPSLRTVSGSLAIALNVALTNVSVPKLTTIDKTFQALLTDVFATNDANGDLLLDASSLLSVGGILDVMLGDNGELRLGHLETIGGVPVPPPPGFNSTMGNSSSILIDGSGDIVLPFLRYVHKDNTTSDFSLTTSGGKVSAPRVLKVGGDVLMLLSGVESIEFGDAAEIAGMLQILPDESLTSLTLQLGNVMGGLDINLNDTKPFADSLAGIAPTLRVGSVACALYAPWACADELERLNATMGGCTHMVGNDTCTSCGRNDDPAFGIEVQCPAVHKCWLDSEKCTGDNKVDSKTCKCTAPNPVPSPTPSPGGPSGDKGHGWFSKTWHIVVVVVGATLILIPLIVLLVRRIRSSSSTAGYEQIP
eukprot:CAMPEP_0170733404 /NCGR_PEP_ID=MMETSP0437-20130122/2059_1 /TAXON_ID=0 /ORGANISM="Sexangularia sp." /LENGTH=563 /DNA_ID=CAMNT_0011071689 /DNA_START=248 /DNA_END=1935 /DNA_ORIENTATION=-